MKSDSLLARKEYVTEARRGWRGYTRRVNVTSTVWPRDGKALLKRMMPAADKAEHADLAQQHLEAAKKNSRLWNQLVDRAMLRTFGRPFSMGDYKISAICREEFDERTKNLLRKYAHNGGTHHRLAIMHKMAAGASHVKAVQYCRAEGL